MKRKTIASSDTTVEKRLPMKLQFENCDPGDISSLPPALLRVKKYLTALDNGRVQDSDAVAVGVGLTTNTVKQHQGHKLLADYSIVIGHKRRFANKETIAEVRRRIKEGLPLAS